MGRNSDCGIEIADLMEIYSFSIPKSKIRNPTALHRQSQEEALMRIRHNQHLTLFSPMK